MLQIYFLILDALLGIFLDRARFYIYGIQKEKKRAILRVPGGRKGKPCSQVSFLLCPREADLPPEVEGC